MGKTRSRARNLVRLWEESQYYGTTDKRKQRRFHRKAARSLVNAGTLLNAKAPIGSTPWMVAQFHLRRARNG